MKETQIYLLAWIVFFPLAGAAVTYLAGKADKILRDRIASAVTIAEFLMLLVLLITAGDIQVSCRIPGICQMGLSFESDGFRSVYALIAAFMWMMTTLFSGEYFASYRNRNRYYLFLLMTLGATEGVLLSADLYTTLIFFELMSFTSYIWVAQDEKKEALRAAETYLAIAVIGGLSILMGLFWLYHQTGTLQIDELYQACQGKNVLPACICMFVGFGAKAGVFPLHIWLPKAHPVAPAPASALLSGILTKTGIFGILVISCKIFLYDAGWGTAMLIMGVLTMLIGAVLAVFSVDIKRTLACSSVSQIGFILVGIGMQGLLGEENLLAIRGTMLHMVNHSLFKLTLFMVAGVIYMNLHRLDLNEIRGFGRNKPLLKAVFAGGALGISGVPLFSGYISKTLLHESIVEYSELMPSGGVLGYSDIRLIEWLFLISGGLTVAYMCKLYMAVFVEENQDTQKQTQYDALKGHYMNKISAAVLGTCAIIFPVMGFFPHLTMDRIADMGQGFMGAEEGAERIAYYSFGNLSGSMISLLIGILVYVFIIRTWMMQKNGNTKEYVNRWPAVMDLEDYLYRPILLQILPTIGGSISCVLDRLADVTAKLQPLAGYVEASFFDTIQDPIIVEMKKDVYHGSEEKTDPEEGNHLTHVLGRLCNAVKHLCNATIWRKHPCQTDFIHKLSLWYEEFRENTILIGRSMSYGLLLFSLGLCITLIYLLISAVWLN
mgnify:CR=1 FL=1